MSSIRNNQSYFLKYNFTTNNFGICIQGENWLTANATTIPNADSAIPFVILKYDSGPNAVPPQNIYPMLPQQDTSPLQYGNIVYISSSSSVLAPCLSVTSKSKIVLDVPKDWKNAQWKITYSPFAPDRANAIIGVGLPIYLQHVPTQKYMGINGNNLELVDDQSYGVSFIPTNPVFISSATTKGCASTDARRVFTGTKSICQALVQNQLTLCSLWSTEINTPLTTCPGYTSTNQYVFNTNADCLAFSPFVNPPPSPSPGPDPNNSSFDCSQSHSFIIPGVTCGPNDPQCCKECQGLSNEGCYNYILNHSSKKNHQMLLIGLGLITLIIVIIFLGKVLRK